MKILLIAVAVAGAAFLAGCSGSLQDENGALYEQISQARGEIIDLQKRLQTQETESAAQIRRLKQELDTQRRQLAEKDHRIEELEVTLEPVKAYWAAAKRKRDAADAERRRREEALRKVREANQPAVAPFRVYDVAYARRQVRGGAEGSRGEPVETVTFSIRNYTPEPLTVRAWTFSEFRETRVTVPAYGTNTEVSVIAENDYPLQVRAANQTKTIDWKKNAKR